MIFIDKMIIGYLLEKTKIAKNTGIEGTPNKELGVVDCFGICKIDNSIQDRKIQNETIFQSVISHSLDLQQNFHFVLIYMVWVKR